MRVLLYLISVLVCGAWVCLPGHALAEADRAVAWQRLQPGLEYAAVAVVFTPTPAEGSEQTEAPVTAKTTLVRIDPGYFSFSLYMATEKGKKTFAEIGNSEGFVAAINAGMYKPDGKTSTGYLRNATHTNNDHVAARLGAFFVANPKVAALPPAQLMDRARHDWETALQQYALVMQNFRMVTAEGRVVWKEADRKHSVAALSQDTDGRIVFILCTTPVQATEYVAALKALVRNFTTVMYLEGGSEAALYLNAGGVSFVEAGRHPSGLFGGGPSLPLPNVLGIRSRKKNDPAQPETAPGS